MACPSIALDKMDTRLSETDIITTLERLQSSGTTKKKRTNMIEHGSDLKGRAALEVHRNCLTQS